jgi:hypothetical protein
MRLRSIPLIASMAALTLTAVGAPAAFAQGRPETFGPFVDTGSFIGFECDGFDILIEGTVSTTVTVWFDDAGDVERVLQRTRAPHDTMTNTITGRSIVVRAHFQEKIERISGTDTFEKTITGFRYLVNEPGSGVTIRDVGRIRYGDLEQTILLWQAGEHDLALDAEFLPVFCGALA